MIIANDNIKGRGIPGKTNVVNLDDRRPHDDLYCRCVLCGKLASYKVPITWLLGDIQCNYCGNYGSLCRE